MTFQWWFEDAAVDPTLNPSATTHTLTLSQTAGRWSMTAWADYDGDGDLDCLALQMQPRDPWLFLNRGNGAFVGSLLDESSTANVANAPGIVGATMDYDGDGWPDVAIGYWGDFGSPGVTRPNVLLHNLGAARFEVVTNTAISSKGAHVENFYRVDYDNDGFLDLLVLMWAGSAPHGLYRNNLANIGNTTHWLKVQLRGVSSSSEGIGAQIRVQAAIRGRTVWQLRQVGVQSSFPELVMHFGLGDATKADLVRIEWPSGIVQELTNVAAAQVLTITEHQEYGGEPPRFNGVTPPAAGCQIMIAEPAAGPRCVLEASSDLVTWSKRLARTSAGGTHEFLDIQATNRAVRFYRLLVP